MDESFPTNELREGTTEAALLSVGHSALEHKFSQEPVRYINEM